MGFDSAAVLKEIERATAELIRTVERLTEADLRGPSLLPGWSRGHLLTHVARNADGGTRLLTWARTGIESHEYESLEARAEEIEAGSARSAAELLVDVRESAARFAEAYRMMPPDAWDHVVRWTGGQEHPAARAADARLTEVMFHHVDLDAGFTTADWPAGYTRERLESVVASFGRRPDSPPMRLHATDTGADLEVGADGPIIRGPQHALAAWLIGRGTGEDLEVSGADKLPTPPFLF